MATRLLLLTGFEPFAGATRNPSGEVARQIGADTPGVVAAVLPVVFAAAGDQIAELIARHRPSAWVGLGLHERATAVTLERQAVNRDDARLPDNAGDERRDRAIDPHGPDRYPATLPLADMAAALGGAAVPWVYSDSAGRFVCNHTFYRAAAAVRRFKLTTRVGFVHVPWPTPDWGPPPGGGPGLPLADIVAGVRACVAAAVARACPVHRRTVTGPAAAARTLITLLPPPQK